VEDIGELDELVTAAKRNDPEALGTLCERFFPQVYRFMISRVASPEDAEDLASEVCVRVVASLPKQRGFFPAWLFRIARNLVTDHYRREASRRDSLPIDDEIAARVPGKGEIDLKLLLDHELEEALTRLTPEQEEVIRLRFVEGYETAEIAEIQGRAPGAVRALQFRAIASLREFLATPVEGSL
jgi:RNA polymerase sigma-70 factor (ECF subfamily)